MKKILLIILSLLPLGILAQEKYSISNKSVIKHISFQKNSSENYIKAIPNFQTTNFLFVDDNNNQVIEAEERSFIRFSILNVGNGLAKDVKLTVSLQNTGITGLEFEKEKELGDIYSMREKQVSIAITGRPDLVSGVAEFRIDILDQDETNPDPLELEIPTKKFSQPHVIVAKSAFFSDSPGLVESEKTVYLNTLIQNVGEGYASQVQAEFLLPSGCSPVRSNTVFHIGQLDGGKHVEIEFPFKISREYTADKIPIDVILTEKYKLYSENITITLDRAAVLPKKEEVTLNPMEIVDQTVDQIKNEIVSDIDLDIPKNMVKYSNRLALVIGNQDYEFISPTQHQNNFQTSDALSVKNYLIRILGLKEDNIFLLTNATSGTFSDHVQILSRLASRVSNAEIFVYFSGLGFIDHTTLTPYLLPTDASGEQKVPRQNLFDLFQLLSQTRASKINFFLDVSFIPSGDLVQINESSFREKVDQSLGENMIVYFSAGPGQTALPYKEQSHGLFTYYLLKNLKDTQGKLSYAGLGDYVSKNVSLESLKSFQKEQDPEIHIGKQASSWWRNMKINDF